MQNTSPTFSAKASKIGSNLESRNSLKLLLLTKEIQEETEIENIKECKTVDACEIKQEKRMEERVVDRQVCNETKTEQKEKCTLKYEQGPERVSITDLFVLVSKI